MVIYYILLPLAWLVFHIGFRVHTVGRENLRKVQTKGCIIAPNHVSAIDPVFIVISRFWGRRMIVFAKKELFEINAFYADAAEHYDEDEKARKAEAAFWS